MLLFLIFFGPGVIAALLYDKLCSNKQKFHELLLYAFGLSFLSNMLTLVVIWLRGHEIIILNEHNTSFFVKYMGISLVFACLIAIALFGLSLIKAGKKDA